MREIIRCYRRGNGGTGAYLDTACKVDVADPRMSTFSVEVDVVNRNRGYSGDIVRLLLTPAAVRELRAALDGAQAAYDLREQHAPAVVPSVDDEGDDDGCLGHPAGPHDPMGQTVYCDGSCRGGA